MVTRYLRKLFMQIILCIIFASSIYSQTTKKDDSKPKTETKKDTVVLEQKKIIAPPALNTDSIRAPEVVKVYSAKDQNSLKSTFREEIIVEVQNMIHLMNEKNKSGKRLILFFDDEPLKDVEAIPFYENENRIKFYLSTSEATADAVAKIMKNHKLENWSEVSLRVSIGLEGENPIRVKGNTNNFRLVLITKSKGYALITIIILVSIVLIYFARKSNLLRELYSDRINEGDRPYSLALTQMALWFALVLYAVIFLYIGTWIPPKIPGSLLILMGISAGTGLTSAAINYTWMNKLREKYKKYLETKENLQEEIAAEKSGTKEKKEKQTELKKLKEDAEEKGYASASQSSKGFFNDMVSDSSGVSLHRFQIAVWTIAILVYFVISVLTTLTLPDFSESLLALMGISSGTYAGFKMVEKNNS